MKSAYEKVRRGSPPQPVPRGVARTAALAAIAAEARRRILATGSVLESITPQEWARYKARDLPEILGSGPGRRNPGS